MRAELWERKADLIAPYSGVGLSARDIARLTGLSHPTVSRYAEKFGFDFSEEKRGRPAKQTRSSVEMEVVSRLVVTSMRLASWWFMSAPMERLAFMQASS